MASTTSDVESERHVVLVHGTRFIGRSTRWTDKAEAMSAELEQRIPGVVLHVHEWGGANTHRARIKGARSLARTLEDLPGPFAVIAHSHGGNVARAALGMISTSRARPLLVTLGTPFLFLRKRRSLDDRPVLLLALVGMVAIGACIWLNLNDWYTGIPTWLFLPFLVAPVAVLLFFVASSFLLYRAGVLPFDRSNPNLIAPEQVDADMVVLATGGDEAGLALAAGEVIGLMAEVVGKIYSGVSWFLLKITALALTLAGSAAVIAAVVAIVNAFTSTRTSEGIDGEQATARIIADAESVLDGIRTWLLDNNLITDVQAPDLQVVVVGLLLFLVASVLLIALLFGLPAIVFVGLRALQYISTGFDALALHQHVDISVSALAAGQQTAQLVASEGSSALRHSSLTFDESTVRHVVDAVEMFFD